MKMKISMKMKILNFNKKMTSFGTFNNSKKFNRNDSLKYKSACSTCTIHFRFFIV